MGKRNKESGGKRAQWKENLTRIKGKGGQRLHKWKEAAVQEDATVVLPPVAEREPQGAPEGGEPRKPATRQRRIVLGCLAGLAVVLLAGYLVLCGTVCQSVMLPNTYVNGRDISGLTLEEATQVVQDTFSQDYASIGLTVAAEGKEYGVDLTAALDLNAPTWPGGL